MRIGQPTNMTAGAYPDRHFSCILDLSCGPAPSKRQRLYHQQRQNTCLSHMCPWIRLFCHTIDLLFPQLFRLLSVNDSAISMTKANIVSNRAKHINLQYHFICEHISLGTFVINWIPTNDMTADIFTKVLSFLLHTHHAASLGLTTEGGHLPNQNQITQV